MGNLLLNDNPQQINETDPSMGENMAGFSSSAKQAEFLAGAGPAASEQRPSLDRNSLVRKAHASVNATGFDNPRRWMKVRKRTRDIEENPGIKISINTEKLKQILDYDELKCHPHSSVARDQAIKGSDIDGGIIITKQRGTLDQELSFVQELRNQGFSVFHKKEYEEFKADYDQAEKQAQKELIPDLVERELNQIGFYTKEELEDMLKDGLTSPTIIYLAGARIGSDEVVPELVAP